MSATACESAEAFVPPNPNLATLREAASHCTACPLFERATQTVFGEGPADADYMLVGEVPGDQEDRQGHVFVGPSGRLLDRCLEEAGLDRGRAYVTNAVKHFKYKATAGKRRLHDKPRAGEIRACKPWVLEEIRVVKPKVLVALGATAAQALIDPRFKVTKRRGEVVDSPLAPHVLATVHPSSLLRKRDDREADRMRFVEDLMVVRRLLDGG